MALQYEKLSDRVSALIGTQNKASLSPFACLDEDCVRRDPRHDRANAIRTPFVRDVDKIIHCPYFNRYADKTQVFSFFKNDDITHRSLHVQIVSRIARTIGKALGLNQDLIEAISLGHDMGHTPFGHAGERILDKLSFAHTGRHFSHNLHSVRVLDQVLPLNISLQTLDGIVCHNGEMELEEYRPRPLPDFETFDATLEACYLEPQKIKQLVPSTLEGCIVRISDMVAYIGKDRQDARRARIITEEEYQNGGIGIYNAEIINNLVVNIVEHSFGKPYIQLDPKHFSALKAAKRENYELIYGRKEVRHQLEDSVEPMMHAIYERLLEDLIEKRTNSPVYRHHIDFVNENHYTVDNLYNATEPNQIVIDYIASMTDDYFIDLYGYLFPDGPYSVRYKGYFDGMESSG